MITRLLPSSKQVVVRLGGIPSMLVGSRITKHHRRPHSTGGYRSFVLVYNVLICTCLVAVQAKSYLVFPNKTSRVALVVVRDQGTPYPVTASRLLGMQLSTRWYIPG